MLLRLRWHQFDTRLRPLRPFSTSHVRRSLRPYQQESIDAIQAALNRRVRPAVSLPTGSGKTRIFSHLLKHVQPMFPEDQDRTKVLVIVNRKELMDQAAATITQFHPELRINALSGSRIYDPMADVVIATYQTMSSNDCWRLYEMNPNEFKLVIIDEAHHSVASSYFKVLEYFKAVGSPEKGEDLTPPPRYLEDMEKLPSSSQPETSKRRADHPDRRIHVVGFSATFWRGDREFLSDVYDEICYHESVDRMIADGYLCPARLQNIRLPDDAKYVRATEFFLGEMGPQFVYDVWAQNQQYKSTVVFGINNQHIENMANVFRENGVDARIISGIMSKTDREAVLAAFQAREFPVLMNCQVLTEGTDIPAIDQIIIARGLGSKGLAMQIVGRGLRLYPQKDHCNVVMFPDFQRFEGAFLPQLENVVQRRNAKLDEEEDDEDLEELGERPPPLINYRSLLSDSQEFNSSLLSTSNYTPTSPVQSLLQWTSWKGSYYLFPQMHNQYFVIDRKVKDGKNQEKLWQFASIVRYNKKYTQRKDFFVSNNLADVTQYADQYAKLVLPARILNSLYVRAKWVSEPLTAKQQKLLQEKSPSIDLSAVRRGSGSQLINLMTIGCKLNQDMVDSVQSLLPLEEKAENLIEIPETPSSEFTIREAIERLSIPEMRRINDSHPTPSMVIRARR